MTVYQIKTKTELAKYKNDFCIVAFVETLDEGYKVLSDYYKDLSEKYTDINFIEIDTKLTSRLAESFKVTLLPTYFSLKRNVEIGRVSGASKNLLNALVKDLDKL
jgi:hypothetical protein